MPTSETILEQKVINDSVHTLIMRTKEDADFSALMAHFSNRKDIMKALGRSISDGEHRTWFFILNSEKTPVACGSHERNPGSPVVTLKSTWVDESECSQELYEWLFAVRLQQVEALSGVKKIASMTIESHRQTHEQHGFRCILERKKVYTYRKNVKEKSNVFAKDSYVKDEKTGNIGKVTSAEPIGIYVFDAKTGQNGCYKSAIVATKEEYDAQIMARLFPVKVPVQSVARTPTSRPTPTVKPKTYRWICLECGAKYNGRSCSRCGGDEHILNHESDYDPSYDLGGGQSEPYAPGE